MNAKLHFVATKVDGTILTQDIECPADKMEEVIQTVLIQISQVGMLRREGNKFTLISAQQIATVEVEIPSIITATSSDISTVAKAENAIRKIIV